MSGRIEKTRGNTPVRNIPHDYYPKGSEGWFVIPEGDCAGMKMFFWDKTYGDGEPETTVVMTHGNPECSYAYRNIIKALEKSARKTYRLVMMDHIGFGLSDQTPFQMVPMHHAENLIQLVRYLDLTDVTLVIHDWGGPIGVGTFIKDPERVTGLVVTNTTVFPFPNEGLNHYNYPIPGPFSWSRMPYLVFDALWGIHAAYAVLTPPKKPVRMIWDYTIYMIRALLGWLPGKNIEAQRIYREQFGVKSNARMSKRMVLQCPVWAHGNTYKDPVKGIQDTTPFYRYIQENITRFWGPEGRNIPARAVLGAWDPLAKQQVIDQWTNALPRLKGHVTVHENVSHFVNEMRPVEVADAIIEVAGLA
ncbi:MAG: alpha/beta fold hydrolase [Thermodesulfobacteriota bacterium]|nr:alpha/beta fold hydrolase [Thermodesulfobacteriota bacterium]